MTRSQEDLEDRLRRVLDEAARELPVGPAIWDGPRPGSDRRRLPRPGASVVVALAGAAVAVLVAVVALTSLHGPTAGPRHHAGARSSQTPAHQIRSTTGSGVSAGSVERALLRQKNPPRPTAASCRTPTARERAAAPIGGQDSVFFSCRMTLGGHSARYYVQVILSTGSFIAAQESQDGRQIFGCCVARPSRP